MEKSVGTARKNYSGANNRILFVCWEQKLFFTRLVSPLGSCVLRNQVLIAHAADAHIRFTFAYNRTLTLKTIKCAEPRRKGRCKSRMKTRLLMSGTWDSLAARFINNSPRKSINHTHSLRKFAWPSRNLYVYNFNCARPNRKKLFLRRKIFVKPLEQKHEKAFSGQCLFLKKKQAAYIFLISSSGQACQKVAGYRPGRERDFQSVAGRERKRCWEVKANK